MQQQIMSDPLTISLLVLGLNLVGLLLIFPLMASAAARLNWHGHGVIPVIITIVLVQLFWLVPAFVGFHFSTSVYPASFALCFGNSIVSAFAIVILCQKAATIPRQLEDSARMDGCGSWGVFWHVVLPRVKRELILIGFLIVAATTFPFLAALLNPTGDTLLALFESFPRGFDVPPFGIMLFATFVLMLPVIVTFILAKDYLGGERTLHKNAATTSPV